MVYKRFVKKRVDGKVKSFGPYYYESYRDKKGRTRTRYVSDSKKIGAVTEPKTKKNLFSYNLPKFSRKLNLFLMLGVISFFIIAGLFFVNLNLTGKVSLNFEDVSSSSELLKGNMKVILEDGEFIPASTKVFINNSGEEYFFDLKDLVENDASQGSYYISGKNVSGSGDGYGFGSALISFILNIYNEKVEGEIPTMPTEEQPSEETNETSTTSSEETPSEVPTTPPEETPSEPAVDNSNSEAPTIPSEEQPQETDNSNSEVSTETPSETTSSETSTTDPTTEAPTETTSVTGSVIKNIFGFFSITGKASMELSKEVSGSVSADEPFSYDLSEGQTAEIKEGSVSTGDDKDVNLKIKDSTAIVSADKQTEKEIILDLSKLNIPARNGELSVSLIYGDEVLVEDKITIKIKNETELNGTIVETNETEVKLNETETNETLIETNETIIENISGLQLIKNFSDLVINVNNSVTLQLSDYFANAVNYSSDIVENITIRIDNGIATIIPDENFVSNRTAKFIAYNENETLTGNLFNILVSPFIISNETNVTIITSLKEKIRVGQTAKWMKNVTILSESVDEVNVELPSSSENISVKKIDRENKEETDEGVSITQKGYNPEGLQDKITGNIIGELNTLPPNNLKVTRGGEKGTSVGESENNNGFFGWFKKLFRGITGRVVEEIPVSAEPIVVTLNNTNTSEYTIEYETPAPTSMEENVSDTLNTLKGVKGTSGKLITISAADELNYTDVIAFTDVPKGDGSIKLIWKASREDAEKYGYVNSSEKTVIIDGKEVPYDIYLKKKKVDELRGMLNG